jgi:hypothetical protein
VGEVIHYFVTLKNHGKVPISNITVTVPDAVVEGNSLIAVIPAPGTVTVAATRIITQADLNAGQISNGATASARYPDGIVYTENSNPVTLYAVQNPQLTTVVKVAENSFKAAGDQIHYTIEVSNPGNLPVTDIGLLAQGNIAVSNNGLLSLEPGKTEVVTADYTITAADLDAGKIVGAVYATGYDPGKQPVHATGNEVTVNGLQYPKLSTVATALETSFSAVGEVIHYRIQVKNSGNVSIISTAVTDPNAVIIDARPVTNLAAGESVTISAEHLVTQADMDAGKVVTVAKAEGFDLKGNTIDKKGNPVTVSGIQRHELTVQNTPSQLLFKQVGEVIHYSLLVRNSGNVSLKTIGVTDPVLLPATPDPIAGLLPGEAISVAASHTVTQADMDAGMIVSQAKAAGFDLYGKPVENYGNNVTVVGEQRPELTAATATSVPAFKKEGEKIAYTVVVKNTGNVTMTGISITDAKVLLDFSRPMATLAPGETDSVTAVHSVTIDDIIAGKIVTAGIAHGYALSSGKHSYLSNEVIVRLAIENYNLTNYPNPFAYETTISFDLPENGRVILRVYDITGREVGQISQQEFSEGRNFVHWKTLDTQKGIYILKMYYQGNQVVRVLSVVN